MVGAVVLQILGRTASAMLGRLPLPTLSCRCPAAVVIAAWPPPPALQAGHTLRAERPPTPHPPPPPPPPHRCPAFKLLTYYGGVKERAAKRQGWSKPNAFHVCITSYTLVLQARAVLCLALVISIVPCQRCSLSASPAAPSKSCTQAHVALCPALYAGLIISGRDAAVWSLPCIRFASLAHALRQPLPPLLLLPAALSCRRFETPLQDARVFKRKKWKYLILDEAHMIKNWKSQRWQVGGCCWRGGAGPGQQRWRPSAEASAAAGGGSSIASPPSRRYLVRS